MRSYQTNVERSVDLFMKVDHSHLSDIREMRQVKRNFDIAYSTVVGIGLDAFLRKFIVFLTRGLAVPILWQTNHISVTSETL